MAKVHTPLAQKIEEILEFDKRLFFLVIVLIFICIRYLTNTLILEAIPDGQRLDAQGDLIFFHIFNTLNYLWTPFALLWKCTVIAFLFWSIGLAVGFKVRYKPLWQFALVAEAIFILPELIRFLVFLRPSPSTTYLEIQNFEPLSALWLLGADQMNLRYHYALSHLNTFEVLYMAAWVLGFHTLSKRSVRESILVVLLAYGIPFLLWLGFYIAAYR